MLQYSVSKYSLDLFVFFQVSARFSRVMVPAGKVSQSCKFMLCTEGFCKHMFTTDHIFRAPYCFIALNDIPETPAGVPECGYLIWGFIAEKLLLGGLLSHFVFMSTSSVV
jgi:hypothetical protein